MQAKKDPEAVRRIRVRQLWEAGLLKERTAIGVLDFYGWLDKHDPDLLPPGKSVTAMRRDGRLQGSDRLG